jgi:hypothetical protein
MRPDPFRARSRPVLTLPAAAALLLVGCGAAEEPGSASASGNASTAEHDHSAHAPAELPADVVQIPAGAPNTVQQVNISPFQVPIEGPIEYEEATEQPLVTAFPAPPEPQTRPELEDLPDDDAILGRPLVIDGEVVPFEEIKKQVCLGVVGVPEIALARTAIFMEEERQRLIESGASADRLDLAPDEVERYLQGVEASLKVEYPEGQLTIQDMLNSLASNEPKRKLHSQMLFARLFLPENPAHFPPLTLEAILKSQGGQITLDHYKSLYEESQATGQFPADQGQNTFDQIMLQQILQHLISVASIVPDPAPGVLYRVNGVDITVDQIWNKVRERVTTMDVLSAKQWIVNTTLLKKALVAAGAWLSDEEAYAAYHAHSDPYKDSIFSIETVALTVKQFPSIERYAQHHRIQASFERLRKPSDAELKEFAEHRSNKIIGQVTVDADVILCSAWEFKANRWKENGWVEAENRMRDALRLLIEEQRPWDELVETYSDYYEAPTPVSRRGQENPKVHTKGRFRNIQRNALVRELSESDYNSFLTGTSVADFIFFEQEVGTLGQPMRGPLGWYLPRLIRRTKAPTRIPMDEATLRELVLDDYLTTKLNDYAQELIAKSEVYGLEYPGTEAQVPVSATNSDE